MRRLLDLVFGRWVMLAVLLVAVSMIVWIGSPLLWVGGKHPFQSRVLRWSVIAAIVLVALLLMAWSRWRADRGNASVVEALLATSIDEKASAESADMRSVRKHFEKAMLTLRKTRFGEGGALSGLTARLNGRYLYELPWYMIIGAPGSGKTTALENCGLNFPLASGGTRHAIRGVGGTRSCDWWFTDQAVLIDTAGRFTTQDSDRANDSATWSGFLAMLKRARPRQPVNGVLVTVSITELITKSGVERRGHAAKVRARLRELHRDLGIRFPIYVLVTKSDLLAGFMDYFELLDKEQRATPWGTTFPLEDSTAKNVQRFGPEFDALLQRIDDGLIERLQVERDPSRRAGVYGFANQFAGLRSLLIDFLEAVFEPFEHEAEPMLRGVYFVSGTQEGTPIDRVLGAIARTYRLERAVIAPNHASGKSYFLTRLLGDVVFAESGIAGSDLQWERRRTLLVMGGYTLLALITGGALAVWTTLYLNNRNYVDSLAERVEAVHLLVQGLPDRATADVVPLMPALTATAAIASPALPSRFGFGLDTHARLEEAARAVHRRMLLDALLPRLELRVATQLRDAQVADQGRYEALKTYLMLHEPGHANVPALKAAIEADWNGRGGRALDAARRAQLSSQVGELLALGPIPNMLPEDRALVAFHRGKLAALDPPRRLYGRLREQGLGIEHPDFDLAAVAGDKATLLFARASGTPITRALPGFFTADAYRGSFATRIESVVKQTGDDQAWVLGAADATVAAAMRNDRRELVESVRRLYLADYALSWDAYLADLTLAPIAGRTQVLDATRALGAADGPLTALVKAIVRETTIGVATGASGAPATLQSRATAGTAGAAVAESIVDDRFAPLRAALVPGPDGNTPFNDLLGSINGLGKALAEADAAHGEGGSPLLTSAVPAQLESRAATAPVPLRAILESLTRTAVSAHR